MTNLQLTVMIAAYCGSKESDYYKDTDIYRSQVEHLLSVGMIKPNNRSPIGFGYKFECTDKGRYWLDFVLATPYPNEVQIFEIPER